MPESPEVLGHTHEFAARWRNFRGFADTGWLRIKPLTVLIGPNNSGKSSLLEPMLLLKQSMLSRTGSSALLTRGDYIDSGTYRDFVHEHAADQDVEFSLRWHSHPQEAEEPVGTYPPGEASFAFSQGEQPEGVTLRAYRLRDTHRRPMLTRTRNKRGAYSLRLKTRGDAEHRNPEMRAAIRKARPVDFLFRSAEVRRAGLHLEGDDDTAGFTFRIDDPDVLMYCQATDYVQWRLDDFTDRLYYLGPLREPPRRVYGLSGEMPPDVGTQGEFAPEVIYRWRRDRKRLRALAACLKRFDFSESLTWDDVGHDGFSLLLRKGEEEPTSFLDTGFGMSQVLPLIVQLLKAPPKSWIVTEQPEIHLNPRLQAKLADLFVGFVGEEKGAIVETHSEHFLLRLRTLVATGVLSSDDVALYFVEREEGKSTVRRVPVSDSGHISAKAWPRGFFEDSLKEALSLAQAQARRPK